MKLQESSDFFDQLNSAESFKRKPRVAHHPKPSTSGRTYPYATTYIKPELLREFCYQKSWFERILVTAFSSEDRGPLVEIKIGSSFQPVEGTSKATNPLRSPPSSQSRPALAASAGQPKPSSLPPLPKDVGVEKYSALRLR